VVTDKFRSEPPTQDIAASSRALANAWQEIARVSSDLASARRTIFLAYVAEGFTEAQALELVKSV